MNFNPPDCIRLFPNKLDQYGCLLDFVDSELFCVIFITYTPIKSFIICVSLKNFINSVAVITEKVYEENSFFGGPFRIVILCVSF